MTQVKCESCKATKFFNHIINGVPLITCSDCGAQYSMPVVPAQEEPEEQIQEEILQSQEPGKEETFEQMPEAQGTQSKEEFEKLTGDKPAEEEPGPAAHKIPSGLTPEQRKEHIEKLKGR